MSQLFMPVRVGHYTLTNRLLMAPMIRSRAKLDGTPGDLAAEYYGQRAGVRESRNGMNRPGALSDPGRLKN
jgi:NADPH2 dehydrogenase